MLATVRLAMEAVVACQAPITCIVSLTSSTASAACMTATHRRVRESTTTAAASTIAPATQGQGDGPGIHTASPVTASFCAPARKGTRQPRMTTCLAPGSCRTAGGLTAPIQWVRWSCQIATGASEIFCQRGGALASYRCDGADVLGTAVRLRNTAGDRALRHTPCGPIRR